MNSLFLKYRNYGWCNSTGSLSRLRGRVGRGLIILLGVITSANAAIYKQVDAQGVAHFSDVPQASAALITLPPINTYAPSTVAQTVMQPTTADAKHAYKKLQITQPLDQQALQNQRDIAVTIAVQPTLQPHDMLEIWLDGKPIQQVTNTQLTLTTLDRGEHQLQVKLLDANKQVLLTSTPVTFYVQYAKKPPGER